MNREYREESKTEAMKYKLAAAMKSLMKTTPVEKITIKEIVDTCGTTRQTFYRHFQDKYDLINWYFDKILLESFDHMGEGETVYEGLVRKFEFIQKEQIFFKGAFKSDEQNCLRDHDFALILQFYTERLESKSGQPLPEHLRFLLEMYCQGSIYMTVQWVYGHIGGTPEEIALRLVKAMPAELEQVFEELGLLHNNI